MKKSSNEAQYARVAELADALDSGSSGSNTVWVQVPSFAPKYADTFVFAYFIYEGVAQLVRVPA